MLKNLIGSFLISSALLHPVRAEEVTVVPAIFRDGKLVPHSKPSPNKLSISSTERTVPPVYFETEPSVYAHKPGCKLEPSIKRIPIYVYCYDLNTGQQVEIVALDFNSRKTMEKEDTLTQAGR